jgi:hypothetical protein
VLLAFTYPPIAQHAFLVPSEAHLLFLQLIAMRVHLDILQQQLLMFNAPLAQEVASHLVLVQRSANPAQREPIQLPLVLVRAPSARHVKVAKCPLRVP